jgi:hypothetical protein
LPGYWGGSKKYVNNLRLTHLKINSVKLLITTVALFIACSSFSQSLVGKWKPVFFSLDTMVRADVKADTMFVNTPVLRENFKNDKDPEGSEEMMQMIFQGLFRNIKEMQEEFFADGTYKEINTRTNRIKTGTYTFNEQDKTLVKTLPALNKPQKFTVSWKNDQLVLTGELESGSGKKGKVEVIYEKL